MNYGRFFRLNKNISKVEEGVVIFDYIDLPAYFESSMENIMTPKYPISMTIASNSAQFRLHYSAYKDIDEKTGKETYSYEGGKRVVHMEEVVLELPFSESSSDQLAETINSIYETSFPQRVDTDGNKSGEETNDNKVMGARFLGKLIGQRYHNNRDLKHSIAVQQYKNMQIALDRLPSYSTLWLMDIPRDTFTQTSVAKSSSDDKTKGKKSSDFPLCLSSKDGKNIVKFLRKLLLDFMFDLKHSDVFQNSSYYQRMYSGLMSNFYFSALMHKCEYFYYRDLTEEAIKLNDDKKRIIYLYAEELFKAEKLWTQDIMNPKANIYFNHSYIGQDTPSIKDGYFRYICKKTIRIFSNCQYRRWNSWFAEPEEEMRRVCFTMKDNMEEKRYICNAETLSEYLDLEKEKEEKKEKEEEREKYAIVTGMIHQKDNNRVLISQWFLKRYAIQDILHLHLFKYSDWPFFISLIAVILYLFICPKFITEKFWNHIHYQSIIFLFLFFCPFFICIIRGLTKFPYPKQQIHILWGRCSIIGMKYEDSRISLFQARCKMISKRLIAILLTVLFAAPIAILTPTIVANPILIKVLFFLVVIAICSIAYFLNHIKALLFNNKKVFLQLFITIIISFALLIPDIVCNCVGITAIKEVTSKGTFLKLMVLLGQILTCGFVSFLIYKTVYQVRWLSNMHVFFPRLIAAIAAAWLSLVVGNELYRTFFDSIVSWKTSIGLAVLVFIFVMYEINKILPLETALNKAFRCLGIMTISYAISLIVGLLFINFTGERYLERSGILEEFYSQHVYQGKTKHVENVEYRFECDSSFMDEPSFNLAGTKMKSSLSPNDRNNKAIGIIEGIISRYNNTTNIDRLKGLEKVYITPTQNDAENKDQPIVNNQPIVKDHPIVTTWKLGDDKFFILRDFLIQFAFIAMFIGIFIQMLFQEKTITET